MTILLCVHCANHYGDIQPCDEGRPVNSVHRTKGLPLPVVSDRLCNEGVVCAGCGSYPCHPDCARGVRDNEPMGRR